MSQNDKTPAWLSQVHQFSAGKDAGEGEVVRDPAAVGAALGAIADGMDAAQSQQPSLGDRLVSNLAASAERSAQALRSERARRELKTAEELGHVRAFFAAAWAQFSGNISAGELPGKIVLGRGNFSKAEYALHAFQWSLPFGTTWQKGGKGIWNQPGDYRAVWDEFLQHCRAHGLSPVWNYEHDGVGMQSWWTLSVERYVPEPVVVDAATGGILDEIGAKLVRGGLEDASGARRLIRDALAQGNFAMAARMLGSDESWARALWGRFKDQA